MAEGIGVAPKSSRGLMLILFLFLFLFSTQNSNTISHYLTVHCKTINPKTEDVWSNSSGTISVGALREGSADDSQTNLQQMYGSLCSRYYGAWLILVMKRILCFLWNNLMISIT